jgi:amino acid adenylation domain-containing protein
MKSTELPNDIVPRRDRLAGDLFQPTTDAKALDFALPRTPIEAAVAGIWADVLGLGEVGRCDDFFQLGGDSLLAVRVLSRISSDLHADLPLYELFESPTVEAVAAKLARAPQSDHPIRRIEQICSIPLSSAQRRLWFIDRLDDASKAYHISTACRLLGRLDREALQSALNALIKRHESLRTIFVESNGELVQKVIQDGTFWLSEADLRSCGAEEARVEVRRLVQAAMGTAFDLGSGPLIRGRLIQLKTDEHIFLIVMHHIISDGWSIGVLLSEIGALYDAYHEERPSGLPPLPVQYGDYAHWHQSWSNSEEVRKQLTYWKTSLHGAPVLLELPHDRPRPAVQSYHGENIDLCLSADLVAGLRACSRRLNMTLAMTVFAAWSILLVRLTGQNDVVVGVPIANRRRTELEGLIGFFVNTLAIRSRFPKGTRVDDVLRQIRETMIAAYANQDAPFEHLVDVLQPVRSLSYNPVFQVMFAWQNTPRETIQLKNLTLEEVDIAACTAQFDLLLSLREIDREIVGSLNYASDLFNYETVKRWVGYLENVLIDVAHHPHKTIFEVNLIGDAERRQVVEAFNATQVKYPTEALVHQLFEEQVERTPRAVAVVYEDKSLTYAELNGKANQLAHYLRERGVGADQLVVVCVERSMEMIVGLLGILKAGGAYVPMDPAYPRDRMAYMLGDIEPRVLLTQAKFLERLPATSAEVVTLDEGCQNIAQYPCINLLAEAIGLQSHHLSYVIYTSGSTGLPKGAMNEHRGVVNRLRWMQDRYRLCSEDRVLQKTPFSFDVSVWEFFWTLMSGARLIVARPDGHKDPDYLRQVIEESGVTTLHFVPSMLQVLLEHHQRGGCSSLLHIVCSGEELPGALQRKCFLCIPQVRLSNLYGPTEAAVDVTSWECQSDELAERIPIGRPISNIQIYLLDVLGRPAPIGVAGEIHIGGEGVGRGYLNRPDLTAERFIADPFSLDERARLYKTGDHGRWRADGTIEYLGRKDNQVKVRGFRIELGEIEAQLLRQGQIKEAAVLAREDVSGDKRLVAYVTTDERSGNEGGPSIEALREYLTSTLPEHMVPSAFVVLPCFPLSSNGKLDRGALPVPEMGAYSSRTYEAPQGEVEETLAEIWRSVLRVERVGRNDNFFEFGGNSLAAVSLVVATKAKLGVELPIRVVFQNPAVQDMAQAVKRQQLRHVTPTNANLTDEEQFVI